MRKSLTAAGLVLGIWLSAPQLFGAEFKVVTPPDWADKAGDVSTGGFADGFRFQQLVPADWLSSLPDSATKISQIAFRPGTAVTGPQDIAVGKVTVRLSTTDKQPDGLSLTYAENAGADERVVYVGETMVSTKNDISANGVTKLFDMAFVFAQPFDYAPSAGNLLFDLMVEPTVDVPQIPNMLSDFIFADTGSLVGIHEVAHNATPEAGPPTAPMGDASYIGGNILEITFVPEPSSISLVFVALLIGVAVPQALSANRRAKA